jgi:hypothetical protein
MRRCLAIRTNWIPTFATTGMRCDSTALDEPRALLPENAITNEVILDMFRSEVPTEIIAAKIKMASAYCFDLSVGTIKQMRSSGVPDQIILAMVRRGERKGGL